MPIKIIKVPLHKSILTIHGNSGAKLEIRLRTTIREGVLFNCDNQDYYRIKW